MVAAMHIQTENDKTAFGLRTTDLRNIAIGLTAAIVLIMVAGQMADSGSASASTLEDTKDSRFTCSFTSASTATPNEAQDDVLAVTATASGGGNTCTFTNTGGADTADFTITAAGDLDFDATPDHENPVDSDTDNEYVVIITATDSADNAVATQTITITVQDVALAFTGGNSPSIAESVATNAAVTTLTFNDIPDTCEFTGSGNEDEDGDGTNAFSITNACVITVADADDIDFEDDASYSIGVLATDTDVNTGSASDSATTTVTITITDVAPTVTDNDVNLAEASTYGNVATIVTTGDDSSITWSISSGNENSDGDGTSAFAIAAATGIITVTDGDDIDDETAADAAFTLVISATDGTTADTESITITITNTGPTIVDNDVNLAEASTYGNVVDL
ncbi:uncharacterized protein METZ01_LOCUS205299, partial [marine metagenome]